LAHRSEARYGALLAPYIADPFNLFIISSDFCHWGSRFSYTHYDSSKVTWPLPDRQAPAPCTSLAAPPCTALRLPGGKAPTWRS
jgi:hypothetical protein